MTCTRARATDQESKAHRSARRLVPLVGAVVVIVGGACLSGTSVHGSGVPARTSVAPSPTTASAPSADAGVAAVVATSAPEAPPSVEPAKLLPQTGATSPAAEAEPVAIVTAPVAPDDCAVALAYLAAHAAPGFAHYCRPGSLQTSSGPAAAYTCLPGTGTSCPDGRAEIIIALPSCAASYRNEASNSYWDFSRAGVVSPGTVQDRRTWDPYGSCQAS